MPRTEAQIELESQDEWTATFNVTFEAKGKGVNPFELWVALLGLNPEGEEISATYAGIRWNEQYPHIGDSCKITVNKPIGSEIIPVSFSAFVWDFPDHLDPVSNTVKF